MDKMLLDGQKALVTGAGRGIGAACARALAGAGAAVMLDYFGDPDEAAAIVREITEAGGSACAFEADVASEAEVEKLFAEMKSRFGTIDILVNNAGVQADAPFVEMTMAQWSRAISVDLTGSFLCARAAAREFLARGVVPEVSRAAGKLIFISSVHQIIPWAGHANYAAAKGGVHMLMASIAQELAPKRVRVNAIAPGAVATDINRPAWSTPDAKKELLDLIPYGRVGAVEDIARAVVWLASDESDYVTGATLAIDGGMLLYPAFAHGG
ncbi:MAG TPA: glucose 1-dehydrogenase [Rhodanobacteraceae bacterium]|nr:glucose 1-dehydrogenase [Rhodanobacteraceae bacterium]